MLMVRLNVKDFINTGSDQDLQEYGEYYDLVSQTMDEAQSSIQDPERAALVDDADGKVERYGTTFANVANVMHEITRLRADTLDVVGPENERKIDRDTHFRRS